MKSEKEIIEIIKIVNLSPKYKKVTKEDRMLIILEACEVGEDVDKFIKIVDKIIRKIKLYEISK